VRGAEDFDSALDAVRRQHPGALITSELVLAVQQRARITAFAAANRLPCSSLNHRASVDALPPFSACQLFFVERLLWGSRRSALVRKRLPADGSYRPEADGRTANNIVRELTARCKWFVRTACQRKKLRTWFDVVDTLDDCAR